MKEPDTHLPPGYATASMDHRDTTLPDGHTPFSNRNGRPTRGTLAMPYMRQKCAFDEGLFGASSAVL